MVEMLLEKFYTEKWRRRVVEVNQQITHLLLDIYDGNPIYGGGFVEQTGGVVKLMKSSYSIKLQDNRPPIASFPEEYSSMITNTKK